VLELHQQGYNQVLDADIKGFFDNFPQKVIMAGVAAEVADGNILRIVERFLKAGVMEEGGFQPGIVGTPQGGVISPLLANIALNGLDWQLHTAGYHFVRYADDFVSVEKFKTKIRELTERHCNLDQEVVRRVNAVVRGTANYFATSFSNVWKRFRAASLVILRQGAI
jgi:RNA-directed DNA polymerase